MSIAVDSITLTLKLQSQFRFGLPRELAQNHDALEQGTWYEIEIKERVEEPATEVEREQTPDGAMDDLITKNS